MRAKSKEKTNPIMEKTKKTKSPGRGVFLTKSLPELMDLPVEVLAKIFNFLPNHDVRCGVSLACTKFYVISYDESLVPVKDLCIYGDKWRFYSLRNIEAVSDIILRSKNLTTLKIKALNLATANDLLCIALNACPKLTHVQIAETPGMTTGE